MPADKAPLGQQYHEAVDALKAQGKTNADSIREVAERFGKKENAVRGGIHQWNARHTAGMPSRSSKGRRPASSLSVDDFLASARRSLEDALALLDREVDQAKEALDHAQVRYDEAVAAVKDKKADIEQRLKALQ